MSFQVTVGPANPVFVAPINRATQEWGVYCLPAMSQDQNGRLVIRVNGHGDNPFPGQADEAPDVFFASEDKGRTWQPSTAEAEIARDPIRWGYFYGNTERAVRLPDGSALTIFHNIGDREVIPADLPCLGSFPSVNRSSHLSLYRYADLPAACKLQTLRREKDGKTETFPIQIDDPELILAVEDGGYVDGQEEPLPIPARWTYSFLSSMIRLEDGTFLAMGPGQLPGITDRLCYGVRIYESADAIHWKRRAVVSEYYDERLWFGFDEYSEHSLVQADNGDLLAVFRTEKCVPLDITPVCGTWFAVSHDLGMTWEPAREIADSSVTPHLTKLENGLIVLTYGRPGVHLMVTEDHGATWQGPFPVIGRTLEQELAAGRDYMDCKYFDTISYSNVFPARTGPETLLLCTNLMKHDPGDGQPHRTAVVYEVTITKT